MIDVILTETIKRIEFEIKKNPQDYADIYSELQELILVIRTFRDFISNPTLEQLENLENDSPNEVDIVREELLDRESNF